jgi:hypothetical protein
MLTITSSNSQSRPKMAYVATGVLLRRKFEERGEDDDHQGADPVDPEGMLGWLFVTPIRLVPRGLRSVVLSIATTDGSDG